MMTVTEIYQQMRDAFAEETGMQLHETSEMAIRLHALASQVYGLYAQNQWTLEQCFPQTAKGDYLDYHASLRSLRRNEAARAGGRLRFSIETARQEPLMIEAGTVCMTAALVAFETTETGQISPGELFADIPAQAVEPGTGGNVSANTIRAMSVAPIGVSACNNPEPFLGGVDQEGDESLRARILDSFQRMPNGANAAYYEREALRFPQVAAANVLGRNRGNGTVDVVIAEHAGVPSDQTIQAVQEHLNSLREIAVDLLVKAPTITTSNVRVKIAVAGGRNADTVAEQVRQALLNYFSGKLLGKGLLRANLGKLIFQVDGVENYEIVLPSADISGSAGRLVRLGTLQVEMMT